MHNKTKETKQFKQMLYARKLMVSAFWDREGMLMVEFM
jgi:hypothetical protein